MVRRGPWPLLLLMLGATGVEIAVLPAAGVGPRAHWQDWADAWLVVLPATVIGWSYVAVGCFAWRRHPENRVDVLMTAVGLAAIGSGLWMVPTSLTYRPWSP